MRAHKKRMNRSYSLSSMRELMLAAVCSLALLNTAEAQPADQATDLEIYQRFRAWVTQQPPDVDEAERFDQYRALLSKEGLKDAEIERRIDVVIDRSEELEIEFWNRILTSPTPRFNTDPNAFLVDVTRGLAKGTALDVGMGQGRNAIYLAQQGWEVAGIDPARKAVASAAERARELGLTLNTVVARDEDFDFGTNRWDLIVLSYVDVRSVLPHLYDALKPGGLVVIEAFHLDQTKTASIGRGVVFETNELLRLFMSFRVLRYQDVEGAADFGRPPRQRSRLVRLLAQKP